VSTSVVGLREMDDTELSTYVELRRHLHAHPELRFEEEGTSQHLASVIESCVDSLTTGVAGTGIVARIDGLQPGPSILLRADMDAYPVNEESGVAYASQNPGVSHACGHDVHMSVMAAVALRLAADRPQRGRVTVLFQPAEEIPFGQRSGARAVLEAGVLDAQYDAVLGLHCWPHLPASTIGVDDRISMAAKDGFKVEISGVGAHAATPAHGRDAILAMSTLVSGLHAAVSRRHNPHEMLALNVGTVLGGLSQSLVAPLASATGTLRTHDEGVRRRMTRVIEQVCEGIAIQFDMKVDLVWSDQMPVVMNSPELVDLAMSLLPETVHLEQLHEPPMTSDDFALLGALGPSAYFKLGVSGGGTEPAPSLHSSRFTVDEECIRTGVLAIETLARGILNNESRKRWPNE
jgi:amidohydrolase